MTLSVERHWERACDYLRQRQISQARVQLESLRALAPHDVRTRLLSAQLAWQADNVRDAAAYALDAASVGSDDPEMLCNVVGALLQVGETAAAHALLDHPAWQLATSTSALMHYANFRQDFGEHAEALAVLDKLIPKHAGDAAFHFYRGQQLAFLGRLGAAEAEHEACLALAPDYGRAAYRLVRLRTQAPDDNRLDLIRAGLARVGRGSKNHAAFEFASYHVLEDLGRHTEAWEALTRANRLMHEIHAQTAADQQTSLRRFAEYCATHALPAGERQPDGPCPIFIMGLPRSGTTLLEHMLGNHSQVSAAGELVDFGQQLLRVVNTHHAFTDAFFARLPGLDLTEVGRRYLAQTGWRARGKRFFIDKQPANWVPAGLIRAALPQAKILHMVRAPMDVAFSNYRAMFGDAYAWSYDFETLATHHHDYLNLMQHWHAAFPGAILDVDYADLVREPATTLRKVFAFCGLEWEAGCEDLTRNAEPVSTLSSAQVREPVHARALAQWRPYAQQLLPLQGRIG